MNMKKIVCLFVCLFVGTANAEVMINFDSAQAGYVPGAAGTQQDISAQFSSLGILFADAEHGVSPSVGDCTGGAGSDPFHLYGAQGLGDSFGGCGDTTPNINFSFVDPLNPLNPGFTTSFSIEITDGAFGLGTLLSAYDIFGTLLGTASTTSGTGERIGVSGIGQISLINVTTFSDFTAYDDIIFESVSALSINSVPEPATLILMGLGLAAFGFKRRRRTPTPMATLPH